VVEQGLELLIQAGLGSPPIALGGFGTKLPENYISQTNPMAWTWHSIVSTPTYTLNGQDGFTGLEIQIDCHGFTMPYAMTLARAIDGVLRGGYHGALPDSDHTLVHGIFRMGPSVDGFNDVSRSFVRSLEYLINYSQI
jgi:hypothetical protein